MNLKIFIIFLELYELSTKAGNGEYGYRDGNIAQAKFNWPVGIVECNDSIIISDWLNHSLRAIKGKIENYIYFIKLFCESILHHSIPIIMII